MKIREEDITSIIERKGNGRIFCFGAGNYGRLFLRDLAFMKLCRNVTAFVDNDKEKQGKKLREGDKEYPIIGIKDLVTFINKNDIIIIVCKNYMPILKQLNSIDSLEWISCYVYVMLKDYLYDIKISEVFVPKKVRLTVQPVIPKVIHYCWFGKKELPESSRIWIEGWKKYCPDYEIVEWNEGNYDVAQNKYMEQAYEMGKWAFVSDYARLDIIYHYGGIYLDTDVELVKCMDDLLYQNGFCGFQNYNEINFGLGFGSIKQNIIIREMLDEYENLEFYGQDKKLNLVLCPQIQSRVMQKNGIILNGKYQTISNMTVFPEKVLSGKSQKTRRVNVTEETYSIHHFDASWMEKEDYLSRRERDKKIKEYIQMLC